MEGKSIFIALLTKQFNYTKILSNLSAVLATEPNRFIIFKEPIPDKVLPDHVIRTEKVANEGSCRVECYLEPNCVSLNVGPADEGGHTCELNNATDESPTKSNLKERQHYVHYAIEVLRVTLHLAKNRLDNANTTLLKMMALI